MPPPAPPGPTPSQILSPSTPLVWWRACREAALYGETAGRSGHIRSVAISCRHRPGVVYEDMELDLEIIRTTGRAAKPIEASVVGELTPEDLTLLGAEKGSRPPALKRLRERHHALARHIASGMENSAAAAICGYDISRVSVLLGDPTFCDLVELYRADFVREYAKLHEMLAGMSVDAAVILRERMEDEPDKLKTDQLIEIMRTGADRTGFGPSSKQEVNVNVNMADRLQAARQRLSQRTIDITPEKANG